MRLDSLIGERLGRYQIQALIGRGGMAAVYRAYDPALQRAVALKVLYPQFLADADLVERFRREAVTAAALDHPNIMPIYDVGEADGLVYLAMKLLPGPSLADLLQREGRLPLPRVVAIISEIAAALDEAHKEGVVHRDIKPGNVIFDRHERAILSDFGIAKSLEGTSMTESSVVIGTPDYIAPEQIDGRLAPEGQIDRRADVYALGAMVYRMLTGRRPFSGSGQAVLLAHLRDEAAAPSRIDPALPHQIDVVVAHAMAKQPQDRPATAGAVALELAAALDDQTAVGTVLPPAPLRRNIHTAATAPAPIAGVAATDPALPIAPPVAIDASRRRRLRPMIALSTLAILIGLGIGLFQLATWAADGPSANDHQALASAADVAAAAARSPTATISATLSATTGPTETTEPTMTATATPTPTLLPTATFVPPAATPTFAMTATPPPPVVVRASTTPRPKGIVSATATPRPKVVVAATSAPTPTHVPPTAEPSPTARPAPSPTNPAPTAVPATPTPAAAACDAPMQGGFYQIWKTQPSIRASLGCPLRAESAGQAAEQVFETGTMFWWGPTQRIYVLAGKRAGAFGVYPNTWREGEELSKLNPPAGLYGPVRGFGKVYRNYPAVQDELGWGVRPEAAVTGVYQPFEKGAMLWLPAGNGHGAQIYVLSAGGRFTLYPDPE